MKKDTVLKSTVVEVVIKKLMTIEEYENIRPELINKGYTCQAYQQGILGGNKGV